MNLLKRFTFFCLVLVGMSSSIHAQKQKQLYCHARSGLSLRSVPDLKIAKDTIIKYAEKVSLLSISDSIFMINGLKGSWLEVQYGKSRGFVFSAYLNSFPVKVKNGKHVYLKDYAFENLKRTEGDKNFEMKDYLEKSKETIFGNSRYQCSNGGFCDLDERLYLENTNVQEAMVMFAAYLMDYNDYTFKRKKFKFNKEEVAFRHHFNLEVDEGFDQEYYMSYKLDENENYKMMSVSFDWEGGGGTLKVYKSSKTLTVIEHSYYCH